LLAFREKVLQWLGIIDDFDRIDRSMSALSERADRIENRIRPLRSEHPDDRKILTDVIQNCTNRCMEISGQLDVLQMAVASLQVEYKAYRLSFFDRMKDLEERVGIKGENK
jgi:hypothetical protein